jgi:hypothetical protein
VWSIAESEEILMTHPLRVAADQSRIIFLAPKLFNYKQRLNAVDRLSFDEIYHLGSRARAFLGNSCGIVFYRVTPTEIA